MSIGHTNMQTLSQEYHQLSAHERQHFETKGRLATQAHRAGAAAFQKTGCKKTSLVDSSIETYGFFSWQGMFDQIPAVSEMLSEPVPPAASLEREQLQSRLIDIVLAANREALLHPVQAYTEEALKKFVWYARKSMDSIMQEHCSRQGVPWHGSQDAAEHAAAEELARRSDALLPSLSQSHPHMAGVQHVAFQDWAPTVASYIRCSEQEYPNGHIQSRSERWTARHCSMPAKIPRCADPGPRKVKPCYFASKCLCRGTGKRVKLLAANFPQGAPGLVQLTSIETEVR